jgi:UDP-glucose 4-epimerase
VKILITGASGFMGSHLVDYLVNKGYNVLGVDDMSGGYWRNIHPQSTFIELDLRDATKTEKVIADLAPEYIYHLAADATVGRSQFLPRECTERNYLAFMNLIVPAIKHGLKKIVVTSSMDVYGDQEPPFHEDLPTKPVDIYGISKAAMEQATEVLSQVYGFDYTIVRPHNVYGPRQNIADPYRNVVGIFMNRIMRKEPLYVYGDGEQKRAFTYIDDSIPYFAETMFNFKTNGEILNLGPIGEETINTLASLIQKEFSTQSEVIYLPERPLEVKYAYCTYDKAVKLLGYMTSTSLEEGVHKMAQWAKTLGAQPWKYRDTLELDHPSIPRTWRERL